MTSDLLKTVVAAARKAADARASAPLPATGHAPRGAAFTDSLRRPGIRIVAECKRRSPSRGVLRAAYDPVVIARAYEGAGAAAVSVLTEPTFFDGSLDHLRAVRDAVTLPVLRKDFLVTEFQIEESASVGADAVLLIVAALDAASLRRLLTRAAAVGLAALVEVHDERELAVALAAGATTIGVNSRNLRTLDVSVHVFEELAPLLPSTVAAVAESGLQTPADLSRLKRLRYDAFLIGERFMVEASPGDALATLRGAAEQGEA